MSQDIPPEVQERINILESYTVDDQLKTFEIVHMYPREFAFPNGYYDSKFFDLVLFNIETKTKRTIHNRDGIDFYSSSVPIQFIRIYADGSTLISFREEMTIDIFQSPVIYPFRHTLFDKEVK